MGIEMRLVCAISGLLILCFISTAHAAEGDAVFYDPPYIPSACYGSQDKGKLVAGVSDALWANRAACGRKYRVTCIGGANNFPNPCNSGSSVEVTIVDYCRPQCNGTLNLSRDAFAVIANPKAGKVRVRFD